MNASGCTPLEDRLVDLLAAAARGPKRDGLYALWLTVRTAEGLLPPAPVSAKNHRRRLQALGYVATAAAPGRVAENIAGGR